MLFFKYWPLNLDKNSKLLENTSNETQKLEFGLRESPRDLTLKNRLM